MVSHVLHLERGTSLVTLVKVQDPTTGLAWAPCSKFRTRFVTMGPRVEAPSHLFCSVGNYAERRRLLSRALTLCREQGVTVKTPSRRTGGHTKSSNGSVIRRNTPSTRSALGSHAIDLRRTVNDSGHATTIVFPVEYTNTSETSSRQPSESGPLSAQLANCFAPLRPSGSDLRRTNIIEHRDLHQTSKFSLRGFCRSSAPQPRPSTVQLVRGGAL